MKRKIIKNKDVVRLTNLGNLTLRHLLSLEENYEENSALKRKKLVKLWASEDEMNAFQGLFSDYHSGYPKPLIMTEDLPGRRFMKRFQELGLVRIVDDSRPLEDIAQDISRDGYANPAKYVSGVTIELTGQCNLKCKHCFRNGSQREEDGLDVEEYKKALEPLLRAGIKSIVFTGGEPTLRREDLFEIVDYARQFLELNGVQVEEKLMQKYGTLNPTVEDVLRTEKYRELRKRLMVQLSIPREALRVGDDYIFDEHTPEDVEELLRMKAEDELKCSRAETRINQDHICVMSNGVFANQREFVRKLKSYGREVYLLVSLDSYDEETTDKNRGKKGVFAQVKNLAKICREEGVALKLVAHNMDGIKTKEARENEEYFLERAGIYLMFDSIVQLGNAVQHGFDVGKTLPNNYIGALSSSNMHPLGWCKGFTRPDKLCIRPGGNVGNCQYAYAVPEEFGNLREASIVDIVNGIQNTNIYQMFKDGRIERYQHELDKSLFSRKFLSSCEPVILTLTYGMIKERLVADGVDNPVERANQEVARMYKFTK
jgi:MoaA/NifB/PqqE/SkfB family radical SAM enzyme